METVAFTPIDTHSLRYRARLFMKNTPAVVGLIVLLFVFLLAALGPALSPHDPLATDFTVKLKGPSWQNPFGTDNYGRDIMSRVFSGARFTLLAALMSVAVGLGVGAPVGVVSGYFGKGTDTVLMRSADVLLAFPPMILSMAIVAGLGPSLVHAAIAIGISYIPIFARVARSRAIQIKQLDYVQAAHALGSGHMRIILTDLMPNCMTPLIVQGTVYAGYGILWVAALSFIGLGAKVPVPEWGLMIAEGRQFIISGQWWTTLFPGLFIMLGVMGFTLIGDGLREVFNPKLRLK